MKAKPKQLFVLSSLIKDGDEKQKEKNMQVICCFIDGNIYLSIRFVCRSFHTAILYFILSRRFHALKLSQRLSRTSFQVLRFARGKICLSLMKISACICLIHDSQVLEPKKSLDFAGSPP